MKGALQFLVGLLLATSCLFGCAASRDARQDLHSIPAASVVIFPGKSSLEAGKYDAGVGAALVVSRDRLLLTQHQLRDQQNVYRSEGIIIIDGVPTHYRACGAEDGTDLMFVELDPQLPDRYTSTRIDLSRAVLPGTKATLVWCSSSDENATDDSTLSVARLNSRRHLIRGVVVTVNNAPDFTKHGLYFESSESWANNHPGLSGSPLVISDCDGMLTVVGVNAASHEITRSKSNSKSTSGWSKFIAR